LNHFVFVGVLERTFFGVFFLFLGAELPSALNESLSDGLGTGEDIGSDEGKFVCNIVVFFIRRNLCSIADQFLECLALAHKFDKFGIGRAALVNAVVVLSQEVFKSAATLLGKKLVDFTLGESVLVSSLK